MGGLGFIQLIETILAQIIFFIIKQHGITITMLQIPIFINGSKPHLQLNDFCDQCEKLMIKKIRGL